MTEIICGNVRKTEVGLRCAFPKKGRVHIRCHGFGSGEQLCRCRRFKAQQHLRRFQLLTFATGQFYLQGRVLVSLDGGGTKSTALLEEGVVTHNLAVGLMRRPAHHAGIGGDQHNQAKDDPVPGKDNEVMRGDIAK